MPSSNCVLARLVPPLADWFGDRVYPMQVAQLDAGLLIVFAFGGMTILSARLAGQEPLPRSQIKVDIPEVNYTQPIFYISNRMNVVGTDTDVQTALDTLDAMTVGGGSGDVATDAIWDAKGDLAVGTGANTAQKLTAGTDGYVLTADSAETTGLKWAAAGGGSVDDDLAQRSIRCTIDGGGGIISTGAKKAYITVPYDCSVTGWRVVCDPASNVTLDVWNDVFANFPPTDADSMISTGTKPATSSSTSGEDLTVDWADTTIAENSVIEVEVETNSAATWIALDILVEVT
jgi:hypothetical protein